MRVWITLGLSCAVAGCATQGRLHRGVLLSPAMGEPMAYGIYTPPDYEPGEALPLVVFLHGAFDGADAFDKYGYAESLDAEITAGRVPRAVIVTPEGDFGFWADWYDGVHNYESWVLRDLLPRIATRFGTLPCPIHCHVMGISMGGYGTLRFALLHGDQFDSATIISGPIMDTPMMRELHGSILARLFMDIEQSMGPWEDDRMQTLDPYLRWTSADQVGPRLFLTWGDQEQGRIDSSNSRFSEHLSRHNIPHARMVFTGGHEWDAWPTALNAALRFAISGSTAEQAP